MRSIIFVLVMAQTGCAHYLIPHKNDPFSSVPRGAHNDRWTQEKLEKSQAQFAEWDRKYVSDDVLVIEIYEITTPKKAK